MTESKISAKKHTLVTAAAVILMICPAFLFPKEISDSVLDGMRLAAFGVIPSVFPFLIVSDALISISDGEYGFFSRVFSKIFGVSKSGFSAFIAGSVCGFPVGVKVSSELYESGAIKKDEAERLIGFCNNPSLAFVISAVGLGIFGSLKIGLALYLAVVASAVLSGLLFRKKPSKIVKTEIIARQKFDFVASVKNAGFSCVAISSYIIFFSAVSGLARHVLGLGPLTLLISALSEVSGGVNFVARSSIIPSQYILSSVAFVLAFSGFSVHLQARSLACRELSFRKYYLMKFIQAVFAAILMLLPMLLLRLF